MDRLASRLMGQILAHVAAVLQDEERAKTLWHNWSAQLALLNAAQADIEALGGIRNAFPELVATIIRVNKEIEGGE